MVSACDTTKNLSDDPRMSAYLLDELDPSEKAEWEHIMKDHPEIQAEQDAMKETIDLVRQSLQNEPIMPGSVAVSTDETSGEQADSAVIAEAKTQKAGADLRNPMFRIVLALTAASLLIALSVSYSGNGLKSGQFGCGASKHGHDVVRRNSPFTQGSNVIQEPTVTPTDAQTIANGDVQKTLSPSEPALEVSELHKSEAAGQLPLSGVKKETQKANAQGDSFRREAPPAAVSKPVSERKARVAVNAKSDEAPMVPSAPVPAAAPASAGQRGLVAGKAKMRQGTGYVVSKEMYESNTSSAPVLRQRGPSYSAEAPKSRQDWDLLAGGADGMNSAPQIQMMVTPRVILQEQEEGQAVLADRESMIQPDPKGKRNRDGGEGYSAIKENEFTLTKDETFSTFSIDVDTASYSNVRRFLDMGQLPPAPAVKIEELVNYFKYDYAPPKSDAKEPFASQVEVEPCPWESSHLLARIAIKGKEIPKAKRPPLNLVFLIDVSGSMSSANKLPLVKRAFEELVNQLDQRDQVAIVTYAGSSHVHLKTTKGDQSETILRSIDQLNAGGSTAGADGIRTAYDIAKAQFNKESVNRVILCTDGDFNVGTTNNKELENMIAQKAKSGVFLSILGFGMGNYKDDRLAILSNRGNGNYGYIDDMAEARRLLVDGLTGTLITIAKDVKIQIDFNPSRVAAWRLIGYEDRKLATEDFNNDRKDAGEIGAGHNVTALYEIVPVGAESPWLKRVDKSRYATDAKEEPKDAKVDKTDKVVKKAGDKSEAVSQKELGSELMFVKLRYKKPDGDKSELMTFPVVFDKAKKVGPTADFNFAASVALFGMLLRDSQYAGNGSYEMILSLAGNMSETPDAARNEYVSLVKKAKRLAGQ